MVAWFSPKEFARVRILAFLLKFEIMIDWNKLIKCFGIAIIAFTFLGCLIVGALIYPEATTITFGIISIIALTWVLYKTL